MKRISVIIPVWNSLLIDKVCDALRRQTIGLDDSEVLLVGSDAAGLAATDAPFRFIPNQQAGGAAIKRNLAMAQATGEIILFLDDDCIPAPDWMERHLQRHRAGEQVVGGAIVLPTDSYLQLADNVSAFHDLLPFTDGGPRSYLATANLSLDRQVIERIGPMWTDMRRAEDLEWTVRMRNAGYQLFFEPTALVVHNPARCSWRAVMRHWTVDAPDTLRVRLHYPRQLRTPPLARFRWSFLWLAPAIAAWATTRTFAHRQTFATYWHTIPLVYVTKLAWCWGAFRHFPKK